MITYSHGNLISADLETPKSRQGVIGRYIFTNQTLLQVDYLPIIIPDTFQPRPASPAESAPILRRMEGSSIILDLGI